MISLPGFNTLDKKAPGRVAAWSVAISPADPGVTAELASAPPFAGLGALAGAALALLGGTPPLITFDRSGHYASVNVDAQAGLAGGGFSLVLQRALASDFDRLAAAKAACDKKSVTLVARVSLGWSANKGILGLGGPSGEGLELVGIFAITDITPSVDGVVYRIALKGRELIAHRLSQRRITKVEEAKTPEDAVGAVLKLLDFKEPEWKIDADDPPTAPDPAPPPVKLFLGHDGLTEVQRLGTMIEALRNREGRKPLLVRDGVLHVGVGRAIPFRKDGREGKVVRVSAENGLIGSYETSATPRDPKFDFAEAFAAGNLTAAPEMRRGFRLDLVGAPEIHPGDVVAFPPPRDPTSATPVIPPISEDWDKAIELYVNTVSHRIEPNSGFMTTVTGVQVETKGGKPTSLWDVASKAPVKAKTQGKRSLDDGTAEGALSDSVSRSVDQALARLALSEVGEVTDTVPAKGGDPAFLPLSSNMVVGLADKPAYMQRSAINGIFREGQSALESVPYLSPFAWGPFGLVLPRYPGTRVMLLPGHGDAEDAVDIGALWHGDSSDASARPEKAEPGDWWLKLPAQVEPASASDVVKKPMAPPPGALATNDLTDAKGNRFIEVGQLVIRVGQKALTKATERPAKGSPEHAIIIEHKDGEALITIGADGKVTIKAKDVAVEVSGTMDVKKA